MAETNQSGLDIELDEQVAQGHYSNLAIISHSTSEFILDFAAVLPGMQKARVKSRIILTPEHAKRLLRSLQENIVRYERTMGKIEIPAPAPGPAAKSRFRRPSTLPGQGPRWARPEVRPGILAPQSSRRFLGNI